MEIWKPVSWIDGYKGVLEVSSLGRVRRKAYQYETTGRWGTPHAAKKPDKILSPCIDSGKVYPYVAVQINGKRKKFDVHRLVARAFVDGYATHLTVNHINCVKTDNRVENLEWVTLSKNTQLEWSDGLVNLRGDNHPSRKLSSGQVRIIRRLLSIGATSGELATLCNVSTATISLIKDGKRWNSVE